MAASSLLLTGESRIFAPYRALGLVCGQIPIVVRYVKEAKLTKIYAAVGNFIHAYTAHNLGLVSVSEPMPSDIQCLACNDSYIFAGFGRKVAAMYRDRNVRRIYADHESDVSFILPFGDHLIVIDRQSTVKIWEIESGDSYGEWRFGGPAFSISSVCHPSTYLNKIVLGSHQGPLKLVNIKTGKIVYDFDGWDVGVSCLQQSTAIDVLGIGLTDGRIFLHNLKFNETVMQFRQDWGAVTAITFRTDGPALMITGSSAGHAAVWDLEKKKLFNQILDAHCGTSGGISSLIALQHEPAVISSGADNALKTWMFDLSDGGARLLHSQEGHGKPPTFLRFHGGERGDYVISAGGDADVKMFHTSYNNKNQNLGQAAYVRKKKAKKYHLNWEQLRLPKIVYMASDAARESGWDNIVCCHDERSVVTTWTSRRSRLGSHKLRHPRFERKPEHRNATATCCAVSACGNFALIGYSSGHVDIFNVQSGIYRGSHIDASGDRAHTAAIRGVCSDGLNQFTFTGCEEGKLKYWRFNDKKLVHAMQLTSAITRLELNRDNDLLAVCLDNTSLLIVDVECRRVVRLFENAHKDRMTDVTFSSTGHWVITASLDKTVKIWDMPSSSLVDVVLFPTPCISLTVSSTGEYLATAHLEKLGVYLWVNKTVYAPYLTLKPLPIDYEPTSSMAMPSSEVVDAGSENRSGEEDMEVEGPDSVHAAASEQINADFITYSGLPTPRWAALLDIDVIKERNKPIEPLKKPEKAPFFLPTIPGVTPTFDVDKDAAAEQNKSRISTITSFKPRSEFAKALEILPASGENGKACENVVNLLKRLSPAGIEIELRNLAPVNGGSIELMINFLRLVEIQLKTRKDFELSNSYLSLFVKLHRDVLWMESELRDALERTKRSQNEHWMKFDDLLNDTLCIVQYLKSSVL